MPPHVAPDGDSAAEPAENAASQLARDGPSSELVGQDTKSDAIEMTSIAPFPVKMADAPMDGLEDGQREVEIRLLSADEAAWDAEAATCPRAYDDGDVASLSAATEASSDSEEGRARQKRLVLIAWIALIIAVVSWSVMGPSFVHLNRQGVQPILAAAWRHQTVSIFVIIPAIIDFLRFPKSLRWRWFERIEVLRELDRLRAKRRKLEARRQVLGLPPTLADPAYKERARAAIAAAAAGGGAGAASAAHTTEAGSAAAAAGTGGHAAGPRDLGSLDALAPRAVMHAPSSSASAAASSPFSAPAAGGFARSGPASAAADAFAADFDDDVAITSAAGDSDGMAFTTSDDADDVDADIDGLSSASSSSSSRGQRELRPRSWRAKTRRGLARCRVGCRYWLDRPFSMVFVTALCWASSLSFWVCSLKYTTTVSASLLSSLAPLVLVGWIKFRGHPISKGEIMGVVVAFVGVILCMLSALISDERDAKGNEMAKTGVAAEIIGDLMCLASSAIIAASTIFQARARSEVPLMVHTFVCTFTVGWLQLLFTMVLEGSSLTGLNNSSVFGWVTKDNVGQMLFLGVVGGLIGLVGFNLSVKYLSSLVYTVVQLIDPLLTGIISYFLGFEDPPTWAVYVGGAVVTAGIIILVNSEGKRLATEKTDKEARDRAREEDRERDMRASIIVEARYTFVSLPAAGGVAASRGGAGGASSSSIASSNSPSSGNGVPSWSKPETGVVATAAVAMGEESSKVSGGAG